jgi:hypothetical protein
MSGLGCTVDIENERLANSLSNVRSRRPSTGEFDPLRLFGVDSVADIRPQISFQYERSDLGQAKVSIDGVELGVVGSYRAGKSALVDTRGPHQQPAYARSGSVWRSAHPRGTPLQLRAPSRAAAHHDHAVDLKHAFNLSDEELVERRSETQLWQYFCGQAYYEDDALSFRLKSGGLNALSP